jgi:TRAP-type C4-dicarboxylate transport system substrate-binding protein
MVCSGVFNSAVFAGDDVIEWKLQSEFFESDSGVQITGKILSRLFSEATDGKLKVTVYPGGAIAAPEEMLRATMRGVVDMAHSMAAGPALIVPEAYLLSLHGATKSLAQQYDLIYRQGIIELVREGFKKRGLHFLCTGLTGPLVTMSKLKIEKWSDYKGKKGWADPVTGDIIPKLGGAVSVPVPGWDMYSAMKLGIIDWFHWTIAELEGQNLKEVVKYCITDPVIFRPCDAIYVNQKAWDKLDPQMQARIEDYLANHIMQAGFAYSDADEAGAKKAMAYGVQFIKMDKAESDKFYEACYRDWERIAKMSPLCAKGIEIIRKQSKRLIDY